jgi:hypothetical protein
MSLIGCSRCAAVEKHFRPEREAIAVDLPLAVFPDPRLHWFKRCWHFPQWDVQRKTVRLILDTTG